MKIANLVVAVLYSFIFSLLFFFSFSALVRADNPFQPFAVLFTAGPVLMNWISFRKWGNRDSQMRRANLAVAIVYSIFFAVSSIFADSVELLGLLVLGAPVILNWLNYFAWPTRNVSV
jgi:hypothetical protein